MCFWVANNFSFGFSEVSGSSSRGLVDPVEVVVPVDPGLSVPEMLDVLFDVMMKRFDVIEARLDVIEGVLGVSVVE